MKKFVVIVSGFLLSYSALAATNHMPKDASNAIPEQSAQLSTIQPELSRNKAHDLKSHKNKPTYFEIKMVTDDPAKTINDISSLMPAGKYEKYNVEVKVYPIPQAKPAMGNQPNNKLSE